MDGQKVSLFSSRFYHILDVVTVNGEYEKTLQVSNSVPDMFFLCMTVTNGDRCWNAEEF